MKPIIAITSAQEYNSILHLSTDKGRDLCWYYLSDNYANSVTAAGGIPMLLLDYADREDLCRLLAQADGLLISGGNDVDPQFYGEVDQGVCGSLMPQKDAQEIFLVREMLKQRKPLLGICRGMQIFNVAMGGTLYPHLPSQGSFHGHALINYPMQTASHRVSITAGTQLATVFSKQSLPVNSFHHQGIHMLGSSLRVSARAEDGLIEAIEHVDARFAIGVQWHPEKMFDDPAQQALFQAFIRACANGGKKA